MSSSPSPIYSSPEVVGAKPPQTLAQMVRAKYPGKYDDMDDATIEKNTLAKYPQYKDVPLSSRATPNQITAWDENGKPIQPAKTPRSAQPAAWDENGNPIQSDSDNTVNIGTSSIGPAPKPSTSEQVASFARPVIGPIINATVGAIPFVGEYLRTNPNPAPGTLASETENYTQEGRKEHPFLSRIGDVMRGLHDDDTSGPGFLDIVAPEAAALGIGPKMAEGGAKTAATVKDWAMENPDRAALRGLRVSPTSHAAESTLADVKAARPYLRGVRSEAEMQAAIPEAQKEVWQPYQDALNRVGERVVNGPDGPTTINDLEAERKTLSAQNLAAKSKDEAALQQIHQAGRTLAQNLDRERAVKAALDPALRNAGVDSQLIRRTWGALERVESKVRGRASEMNQRPSGLGRTFGGVRLYGGVGEGGEGSGIRGVGISERLANIPQAIQDVLAGRGWWSDSPEDVGIREGFRAGGEKPNFVLTPRTAIGELPAPGETSWGAPAPSEPQAPGGPSMTPGPLEMPPSSAARVAPTYTFSPRGVNEETVTSLAPVPGNHPFSHIIESPTIPPEPIQRALPPARFIPAKPSSIEPPPEIPGSGGRTLHPSLPAGAPPKTPLSGFHYGNVGPVIEGGEHGVFVTTRTPGSIGEAVQAGGKGAVPIKGNFALADVTAPQWKEIYQQAIQQGAQPPQAKAFVEKAIKAAGYDGYRNPNIPNSAFLFESAPVEQAGASSATGASTSTPGVPSRTAAQPTKTPRPQRTPGGRKVK